MVPGPLYTLTQKKVEQWVYWISVRTFDYHATSDEQQKMAR